MADTPAINNAGSSPRVRGRRQAATQREHPPGLIPASAGQTAPAISDTTPARAHPRECGADQPQLSKHLVQEGSSPRVRGRPNGVLHLEKPVGLIPASAGQTLDLWLCVILAWAHPRECGADVQIAQGVKSLQGSSPRVRGRPAACSSPATGDGLIPASAGQTHFLHRCHRLARAHPRECGADLHRRSATFVNRGSSPRVRGRRTRPTCRSCRLGLIPASAGQTYPFPSCKLSSTAHPRECGADAAKHSEILRRQGSSPRVRGRLDHLRRPRQDRGLIPASAGQTPCYQNGSHSTRAHPRECGADEVEGDKLCLIRGSSPRVRGRRLRLRRRVGVARLIPASAGQTDASKSIDKGVGAHPRECGADRGRARMAQATQGSSPRVRGRQVAWIHRSQPPGLIPASAGQTCSRTAMRLVTRAHPRECGADFVDPHRVVGVLGSSPRVRGRRYPARLPVQQPGLIPASAGQTAPDSPKSTNPGAHPRECGADKRFTKNIKRHTGSSPRVRGRRWHCAGDPASGGLIPASAGQTPGRRY